MTAYKQKTETAHVFYREDITTLELPEIQYPLQRLLASLQRGNEIAVRKGFDCEQFMPQCAIPYVQNPAKLIFKFSAIMAMSYC